MTHVKSKKITIGWVKYIFTLNLESTWSVDTKNVVFMIFGPLYQALFSPE
jgi:hypothetical protein